MNIEIDRNFEAMVEDRIRSGRYQSATEVVERALTVLDQHERMAEEQREKLRQMVAVGIEQADRGECVPWNMEEILAKARAEHARRKRAMP